MKQKFANNFDMDIAFMKAEFPCIAPWHVNVRNYETVDHFMRQFFCQTLTITNSF